MFFLKEGENRMIVYNRGSIEKPYSLGLQKYIPI